MKKYLFVFVVVLFIIAGCSRPEFTIKVSGTTGLRFIGNCSSSTYTRTLQWKKLEETVPAEFTLTGDFVVCYIQKQGTDGTLNVEIIKNSEVAFVSETSDPNGVVKATVNK